MISGMTPGIHSLYQHVTQSLHELPQGQEARSHQVSGHKFNSPKVNVPLLPSENTFLTRSLPSSHPNTCSYPFNTGVVVLHVLIHLCPCQTATSSGEETRSSLPVCAQLKHSAWHTGGAAFALFSLEPPGLDGCPSVMISAPFHLPKYTGVYDKSYDHPLNKQ